MYNDCTDCAIYGWLCLGLRHTHNFSRVIVACLHSFSPYFSPDGYDDDSTDPRRSVSGREHDNLSEESMSPYQLNLHHHG